MKWKAKQPPKDGDVKYATIFPLIPRLIEDTWYWLERVDVKYEAEMFIINEAYHTYVWKLVCLDDRPEPVWKYNN